jgi:class 3 adenylate cyclase/tetratricopeptide (TPR) repeat protein
MACGTRLEAMCPQCGAKAVPGARFCIACGAAIAPPREPVPAAAEAPDLPEERRRVTILFADLVGYTAMAERMDPENVRELSNRVLRRLAEEVAGHGGVIDKYIGDNVMALFGAPVAHEDDPERAVRAGLAMQTAMKQLDAELGESYGVRLQLRVGVNTGEVLAGRVGGSYTVSGDAANVAARLQSAGRPGEVTVGEATMRATRHAIGYRELPPLTLKGKSEPVRAWEAVEMLARQPAGHGGRTGAGDATPFIGRADELVLLDALLARVEHEERAHLVTVVGEPGVGKSRLLLEFERTLAERDAPPKIRHGRCLPYGAGVVYWALGEVVRAECAIVDDDPPETARAKLHGRLDALLAAATGDSEEARTRKVELVGRMLGIGSVADGAEDAEATREAAFAALRSCVQAMGRERALVLAFEDIHWADAGLLDLIEHLAQWVRAPVVVLCLARDQLLGSRPTWGAGTGAASMVRLQPLRDDEAQALVGALLATGAQAELAPAVAARSGGNPLFAEELVQRLLEEGTDDASELPETVHALLAARLDALAPFERRVAQHAAVIGRTFWRAALEPIARAEGGDLDGALAELEARELIVAERGRDDEPELAFKHVLIRDVAYARLPKAVRARKHVEVAAFLEERAGERAGELTPLLAEHFGRAVVLGEEARLPDAELAPVRARALVLREAAGDAAAALFSNAEALGHYEAARPLAAEPAALDEKLGDVALRLGRVDRALEAWEAAAAVVDAPEDVARLHRKAGGALWHKGDRTGAIARYQAGINLLKEAPRTLELVRLYGDAASLYLERGENMLAIYAAEKALRLAEQLGEARAAGRAHGIFGRVFGRMGDAPRARASLERFVAAARELDDAETARALHELAHHLEHAEASYEEAGRRYREALALAERTGDVPAQIELRAALARLAVVLGDWDAVAAAAQECAALAEQEGLSAKLCLPQALRGWVMWHDGRLPDAEAELAAAATGAEDVGWSEIAWAALYGQALVQRDRSDLAAATATLERADALCQRAGLAVQQVQTAAALTATHALAGDTQAAAATAQRTASLADSLPYPVARAAAREADGIAGPGGPGALREARDLWRSLGRRLDAERCERSLSAAPAAVAHQP